MFSAESNETWCEEVVDDRLVPARVWGGQAVVMSPTDRLKLRRRMAAAAGKKEFALLSLFMEVNDRKVEEELSTKATSFLRKAWRWADGEGSSRRHGGSTARKY